MPQLSKTEKIAERLFEYLKTNHTNSIKGIPISDEKSVFYTLYEWALSSDGLSKELQPKSKDSDKKKIALKKSIQRALDLLMETFPGNVGFYIPDSEEPDKFFTLTKGELIGAITLNKLSKKSRYYLIKGDVSIPSLNIAFIKLIEHSMGRDDFGFLNNTLSDSLSYSKDELNLSEGDFHNNWLSKIEISPRYQALYPPKPKVEAEDICRAIFLECSFTGSYLGGEEIRYWPVRLVRQERVLYVLCRTDKNGFYKEYAIHRFTNINIDYDDEDKNSDNRMTQIRPDWISYDIQEIKQDRKPPIVLDDHENIEELVLEFFGRPAQHMSEMKFHSGELEKIYTTKSEILSYTPKGTGAKHSKITAINVPYNYNFLTWLLGFGDQVKVISPDWLRVVIKKQLVASLERY